MNEEKENKVYIEDYRGEFFFKQDKSNLNISFNRIAFIFFIFLTVAFIYSVKVLHLGSLNSKLIEINIIKNNKNFRSDILDRNENIIAKTVNTRTVGINPNLVIDKKKLLINLKLIFPEKDFDEIEIKFNKNKYFHIDKQASQEQIKKLKFLGDKSIQFDQSITRIYPQKNLFSHIIGQIDDNNNGVSGIEKSFDYELRSKKQSLKLTVDTDIQFLVREELIKFQEIFNNIGSAALLMNVNDGEIISLVSLPDFNLNKRKNINDSSFINRATKGTYELGSVFKSFTLAAGLNEGVIETDTEFLDLPKSISCAGFPIREYDKDMPSNLTAEQILIKSGNIGSVRIAQRVGEDKFRIFLENIGVLSQIEFDIEEVAVQKQFSWGKCKLATASYGHGVTTSILQLAKGYSIIANGGYNIKPTLIKKETIKSEKGKRILKKGISKEVVSILRKVVTTDEGTAEQANVKGYEIAGKTGTAQQPIKGSYSKIKINTFASIFPSSKPKYVFIVMLEAPKTSSEYVYQYRNNPGKTQTGTPYNTAGWTSVEVAGKIIEKIGPILATKYMEVY